MAIRSEIRQIDGVKRELHVTVDAEETRAELDRVTKQLVRHAKLPGFRPGKAPPSLVRSHYKDVVRSEVVEKLVSRSCRQALSEADVDPVHLGKVQDVELEEEGPLSFVLSFEVEPEIDLGSYQGLEVARPSSEVSEEEIDERLESLREANAVLEPVDREEVAAGDYVLADFIQAPLEEGEEPRVDEDVFLEAGSEENFDELNEALIGAETGQTVEFQVDYADTHPDGRLAGRKVSYKVRLKGIKRKELPELTDELVQEITDAEDLEELRRITREDLEGAKKSWAESRARDRLMDALLEEHDFPAPPSLVQERARSMLEDQLERLSSRGMDPRRLAVDWEEEFRKMLAVAHRQIRARFLLEKIAEAEGIAVGDDELDAEIEALAESRGAAPESIRARLREDEMMEPFKNSILRRKILDFLMEGATIVAEEEEE